MAVVRCERERFSSAMKREKLSDLWLSREDTLKSVLITTLNFNQMAIFYSYHSHISLSFSCDTFSIYIYIYVYIYNLLRIKWKRNSFASPYIKIN
jgi:hypothetical protein